MKSVRPLVTITILTLVGVFLFRQLNKGPALDEDVTNQWSTPAQVPHVTAQPNGTAPPLVGGNQVSAAPAWTAPVAVPPATELTSSNASQFATSLPTAADNAAPSPEADPMSVSEADLPEVPAIPELPPLAGSSAASPSSTPPSDATPPAMPNIPMAQYPDSAPASPATASVDAAPLAAAGQAALSDGNTGNVAGSMVPSPGPSAETTPLAAAPNEATTSAYAMTRTVIFGLLSRNDLPSAHLMLSQWYGNETLTDAERQEVETLLSQLAGTVIYSNEHRLEPAYTVQAGDTLETIASKYQVPWQLLAKINGIPRVDAVQPGQQLKVLRGPFMAVVDISAGEVALLLDGRYAGKFPLQTVPTSQVADGEWVVENKLLVPGTSGPQQSDKTPSVDRVLVLRSSTPTAGGSSLALGSGSTQTGPTATGSPPALQVSPTDAEELHDILSIGSRVVIRR